MCIYCRDKRKFLRIAGTTQLSQGFVYPTHAWPSYIWKKKVNESRQTL